MRNQLTLASALAVLLTGTAAQAQFNAPIRYNEGPGIKLGERMVFHPGIALEGRYDSNVFYSDKGNQGAPYLRIIGHLGFSTLSPQRMTDSDGTVVKPSLDFYGKAAFAYREYFGVSGNDSVNSDITSQRAFEADVSFKLGIFPQGVFGADFGDDFARTVTARNAETADSFSRDTNRVGLGLRFAPGGGLLAFGLGYGFNIDIFEDSKLSYLNKMWHDISFSAKWKLLPKTAIVLEALEQIVDYYDSNAAGATYTKYNSYPLRVYLGLIGLITSKFSVLAKVGYGNGFYSTDASFNSVLAKVELGYQFGPFAKIKVGYEHNFADALFGNFDTFDTIYLGYDHFIASRFLLHLKGDYAFRRFDGLPSSSGSSPTGLKDHVVNLGLGFDWQIKEWIYVGIGYDLQLRKVTEGPSNPNTYYASSFTKHQIYGKVGVSY
jgi:hypothetical protein